MPYLLRAIVRVRTYELDSFGHVNNAQYLHYLEEARSEFLRQMGLSFADFAAHGVQLVIVEANLRYLRAARYGDELVIAGRTRDVRPASAWIDYRITDVTTGQAVVNAETRGAFLDARTLKPCRAPEAFCMAFAAHTEESVS